MRSVGFRATTKEVYFCIWEEDNGDKSVMSLDVVKMPIALTTPERLQYLRNTLIDILDEFKIDYAGIRVVEPNAKSKKPERINMEGVIQELLASSTMSSYFSGQISKITGLLGYKRQDFKDWVENNKNVPFQFVNWGKLKKEEKEAMITSYAAMELK